MLKLQDQNQENITEQVMFYVKIKAKMLLISFKISL